MIKYDITIYKYGQPMCMAQPPTCEVAERGDLAGVLKNITEGYDMVIFTNEEGSFLVPAEHFTCSVVYGDLDADPTWH